MSDAFKRAQEWVDGGGSEDERHDTEALLKQDPEFASLCQDLELQGELLREVIQERTGEVQGLWAEVEPVVRRANPAWSRAPKEESAPSGVVHPSDEPDPSIQRGWLAALAVVAGMAALLFLLRPPAPEASDPESQGGGAAPAPIVEQMDPALEIETLDAGDASVMIYAASPDEPTIIWVNDE